MLDIVVLSECAKIDLTWMNAQKPKILMNAQ